MESFINFILKNNLTGDAKTFVRNSYLLKEGDEVSYVFWIRKGTVRAYIIDDEGNEQNIRFGYKDDFITDLSSIFKKERSTLYIQSIKKCEVVVIPFQKLSEMKSNETFSVIWANILEDLISQQMEREKDLLTTDPKLRYERVFKRSPGLFQEVPLRYIANYLRMTPETLSRIRKF